MRARVLRSSARSTLLLAVLVGSCTPADGPTDQPPQLALSKSSLVYNVTAGNDPTPEVVSVNNAGGGTLNWTVASNVQWLTVTPAGSSFTVFVATTGLATGTHQATITVTAAGVANSPQTIAVTLTLAPPPSITLAPSSLTFSAVAGGANPAAQNVQLSFSNNAAVAWTASDNVSWLSVAAASGTGGAQLSASVNTTGLAAGTHTATITVSSTGVTSNSPQTVAVTLNLAPPPAIGLSTTTMSFTATVGNAPASQTFDITNTGGGALQFTVSDDATWITTSTASGTAPATVTVSVASGLAAGTYTGTITVAATGASNTPRTIAVTAVISDFSGTWIGKTSQDSTVRIEVVNNAVTQIYLGWRVASCGTSGTTTTNFTTPFSVSTGSFNRTVNSSPLSYTIGGTFTSATAVSGTLTLNFSMTVPFSCSATVSGLTWSATKQ